MRVKFVSVSFVLIMLFVDLPAQTKARNQKPTKISFDSLLDSLHIERVKLWRDDIELRVLYVNHVTSKNKFLIIRNLHSVWSGNFYEFDSQIISKTKNTRELKLSQNWQIAWSEITHNNYLDLPDEFEVQKLFNAEDEFLIVADGESFGCEVVTKRRVKAFSYDNPEVKLRFFKERGNLLSKYYEHAVAYFQLVYRTTGAD